MKIAFYIGRFSPFHNGHLNVALGALKKYDRLVFIIGSAKQPRTIKNPWLFAERRSMIYDALSHALDYEMTESDQVRVQYVVDYPYNDTLWLKDVNQIIREHANPHQDEAYIVGMDKDESSFYLQMFPMLKKDLTVYPNNEDGYVDSGINATLAREIYFTNGASEDRVHFDRMLPYTTVSFLKLFEQTSPYKLLKEEFDMVAAYKRSWEVAPYPPTFVTTDAVVVQSGHVLLVKRGAAPGKGLWALPGGFVNQNESLLESAIRELLEETKLKVAKNVLKRVASGASVFDHPGRSLRGRTITHAFLFALDDSKELPKVKGGDDAVEAFWVPLGEIESNRHQMFEDHFSIIETMIGQIKS